jgi:hypothetical protein
VPGWNGVRAALDLQISHKALLYKVESWRVGGGDRNNSGE